LRDSDLCIWDYEPGRAQVPKCSEPDLPRHLFLTHRRDLDALIQLHGTANLNIVLKPVTHATLATFISGAGARQEPAGRNVGRTEQLLAERNQMLQFLIQANLKLQEFDQERTNFLARSIHDFRAPLTSFSGYCQLLLEEELGTLTSDQRDVLARMQRSARRLAGMAEGMFQLSIAHTVEHKSNMARADIRDSIDQALHEVGPFIENKRIRVSVETSPAVDMLCFERQQIEQMLINLLDNACKFTPRCGAIEIAGYPFFWERRIARGARLDPSSDRRRRQVNAPNSFRIDVRDSGPEIPDNQLEKVFEEYTSYAGSQDRSGGGLGLAISRMIVRQHQGRIWAESGPRGTVFSVVLPFWPADGAPQAPSCLTETRA
jgi:signal transduction histidine kinase